MLRYGSKTEVGTAFVFLPFTYTECQKRKNLNRVSKKSSIERKLIKEMESFEWGWVEIVKTGRTKRPMARLASCSTVRAN
jgi:hypothetical protein